MAKLGINSEITEEMEGNMCVAFLIYPKSIRYEKRKAEDQRRASGGQSSACI